MLSLRSKILVTSAVFGLLVAIFDFMTQPPSWAAPEPLEGWYITGIILALLMIAAGVSVAVDVRRDSSSKKSTEC
jgi:hypothetical protein